MCERYALPEQAAAEREFLPSQAWWKFAPRFNVAPHQYVPAIRLHGEQSEAVMMRWGLIPSWAEGKLAGEPPRCIESDRIEVSTAHREPWLNGQRCILPIAGFYVWHMTSARYRQPCFVRLIGRSVFGMAGIWDRSVGDDDDVIESCSLVRVPSNDLMREIANTERQMPRFSNVKTTMPGCVDRRPMPRRRLHHTGPALWRRTRLAPGSIHRLWTMWV